MIGERPRLVLHADDLGMNRAVNQGIVRGFREGLLTSTSLLPNAPDAAWAIDQWKRLQEDRAAGSLPSADARRELQDPDLPFDLGIHLNLTQGRPLTGSRYPRELLDAKGRFPGIASLFARLARYGRAFRAPLRRELEQQVGVLADRGIRPTHLNGHQYIEMIPALADIMIEVMERFHLCVARVASEPSLFRTVVFPGFQPWHWPLAQVKRWFASRWGRRLESLAIRHPRAFFGTVHAGRVDLRQLRLFLSHALPWNTAMGKDDGRNALPTATEDADQGQACLTASSPFQKPSLQDSCIEIGLHPGEASETDGKESTEDGWHDPLAAARPHELGMLISRSLAIELETAGWPLGRLALLDHRNATSR